jgi:hypothetical protein
MIRPPSGFHHAFSSILAQRDRRADVDVEMLVVGFVGLLQERAVVHRSGVIDEDVQHAAKLPAKDSVDRRDQRPHAVHAAKISADGFGVSTCAPDFLDHFVGALATRRVIDDHGGALRGEAGSNGGADAARRSGHEGELVFQWFGHSDASSWS